MPTTITAAVVREHKQPFAIDWQQGHFPADKLSKTYRLDQINEAFEDSAKGVTVKPVIVF